MMSPKDPSPFLFRLFHGFPPVKLGQWVGGLAAWFLGLGCTVSSPFRGSGLRDLPPETEVVLSLTHANLDPVRRGPFDKATRRVLRGLPEQTGCIGYSVRKRLGGVDVWTMTAWRDEAALESFLASDLHRDAMRQGRPALLAGRTLRLKVDAGSLPMGWKEAEARLVRDGEPVRVPSRPGAPTERN
jgi:quinol monooxygenase YgiN